MNAIKSFLEEGYIFSDVDTYYKFKEWETNKIDKLFIVGLSGSGKTTLGKQLAKKYKCDYIELDKIAAKISHKLYKKHPIDMSKKYFWEEVYKELLKYFKQIKKRSIIEGVHALFCDFNYISKHSIIVLNTSVLLSSIRAFSRSLENNKNRSIYNSIIHIYKNQKIFIPTLNTFKKKLKEKKEKND